ncbi:UDP-N-acetylglucosamine 1-carboxyvinyltransferase [Nocardiopsis coralliicola]
MTHLRITGGRPLTGSVPVQGSKNVFLHLAAASLLSDRPVHLSNVPQITDTEVVADIINTAGARVSVHGDTMSVQAGALSKSMIPPDLGGRIRPTACFGAALLARTGHTTFPPPGGDAFAVRRIDRHLETMRAAGAEVRADRQAITASADLLRGFDVDCATPGGYGPSLGATVTALLLAAAARGESRITSPSEEPEVDSTVEMLCRMGVPIEADTNALLVQGRDRIGGAAARVPADRMAAGTLMLAGAITGGRIDVTGAALSDLPHGFIDALAAAGVKLAPLHGSVRAERADLRPIAIATGVHPGYPTDLQPQLCAVLTQAPGVSAVTETVYDQRETHAAGLASLGADVTARGRELVISGPSPLRGATVAGGDIRAATALVLAALAAEGTTHVYGMSHLRRGYEDLPRTLRALGADIEEEP